MDDIELTIISNYYDINIYAFLGWKYIQN